MNEKQAYMIHEVFISIRLSISIGRLENTVYAPFVDKSKIKRKTKPTQVNKDHLLWFLGQQKESPNFVQS